MIYDTLDLSEVEIFSNLPKTASGFKIAEVDSFAIANRETQSLAGLLSSTTPLFIKNYGPGSLATTSLRGASATHTQVLWNGMNINSPMPGQADFSQIPVFFTDNIKLCFGGGSVQHTSGGLGGSLEMTNKIDWKNTLNLEILQEVASFNTYKTFALIKAGNSAFQSVTRAFFAASKNEFPYLNNAANRENPPVEYRKNAAWRQQGILQEFSLKTDENTIVSARIWAQNNQREIPANITVNVPKQNEKMAEKLLRGQASVEHFSTASKISLQSSYAHSWMNYQNIISEIDDENFVNSWSNMVNYENFKLNRITISSNLSYDFHTVNSENYDDKKSRNEAAFFLGFNYALNPGLLLNVSVRQEMMDGKLAPFMPALGGKLRITRNIPVFLKANVARNFHAPTLNDLYWMPGGNPDLKFEKGFTAETGLLVEKHRGNWKLDADLTCFYSDIDDWIMWQPDSIYSYWTPVNLKNVISQGFETGLKLDAVFNKLNLNYSLNYSFTKARNKKGISGDDLSVGKQLVYVPIHAANQNIRLTFRHFTLNYTLAFTGQRYTSSDNSSYLPSFTIHDLSVSKTFLFGKSSLIFKIDVSNIFNKSYQVIAWQPMPGRYLSFALKYSFLK